MTPQDIPATAAGATRDLNHPVWDVYDDFRSSILNVKIQEGELKRLRWINNCIEIPLAVTASSSVAGFTFWSSTTGILIWQIIGVIAALLACIKPFLKLPEKIQQRGEMMADYSSLANSIERIVKSINLKQSYDAKMQKSYLAFLEQKGAITQKHTGSKTPDNHKRIKRSSEAEVDRQFPPEHFYIPAR